MDTRTLIARSKAARASNDILTETLRHNLETSIRLTSKCREFLAEYVKLAARTKVSTARIAAKKKKKKHKPRLRLVVNNDLPSSDSATPPPTNARALKVRSQLFDVTDSGVLDLATGDLLKRPLGDAATSRDLSPSPLGRLEVGQDVFVKRGHTPNSSPEFGFTQPSTGGGSSLGYERMPRPRSPVAKTLPDITTFIENVEALLPVSFPGYETETDRYGALANRADVGRETIRRAMRGGAACRLDIVAKIAAALGATTAQLLTPGFGVLRAEQQRAIARQEPLPTRRSLSKL